MGTERDDDEDDEAFVERQLEEALKGLEKVLDPEELNLIRASIRNELLLHPSGRELVRRARQDPVVARSGAVPKQRRGEKGERKKKGKAS